MLGLSLADRDDRVRFFHFRGGINYRHYQRFTLHRLRCPSVSGRKHELVLLSNRSLHKVVVFVQNVPLSRSLHLVCARLKLRRRGRRLILKSV